MLAADARAVWGCEVIPPKRCVRCHRLLRSPGRDVGAAVGDTYCDCAMFPVRGPSPLHPAEAHAAELVYRKNCNRKK